MGEAGEGYELGAVAEGVGALGAVGQRGGVFVVVILHVASAAQQLAERGRRGGETRVGRRRGEGRELVRARRGAGDFRARAALRRLVADTHIGVFAGVPVGGLACGGFRRRRAGAVLPVAQRAEALRSGAGGRYFVERRYGMARADLAGIDLVVREVLAAQGAGFVADEPIFAHRRRVELDLDLDVAGDGEQRGGGFLDQRLAGLGQAVDIDRRAVAVLRQPLHERVVVVAHAEA